jgi:RNA polymerase-binding transcription factor DksA
MPIDSILSTLEDKKIQLANRIEAIERDFKKGRSQDFSEQTTECENDEVLDEIHHEAKVELQQVNAALLRIEHDNYGVCTQCADNIAPQRLQALPYIDTCIRCAK